MKAWNFPAFVTVAAFCVLTALQANLALAASMNGAAGQMPAYYDGQLFTVNMKEMPEDASAALIAQNSSINLIYTTKEELARFVETDFRAS